MNLRIDLEPHNKSLYVISYFDPIKRSKSIITRDNKAEADSLASVLYGGNYLSIEMYKISVDVTQTQDYLKVS